MSRPTDARMPSWIGLAVLCGLGVLPNARAQAPAASWPDEARIEAGEILIDFDGEPRFRGRVRAAARIDAPIERVWDVLTDCVSAADYLDYVVSCEVVETLDGGRAQVFRQRARLRAFLPSFEHVFRLDYMPYTEIRVSRVSGPIDRLDAVWRLWPEASSRTRVAYELDFDGGPFMPNFLVSGPLRRNVVDAITAARERAEAR